MLDADLLTPSQLLFDLFGGKRFKLALRKVNGIEIEPQQFLGDGQGNQWITEILYSSGRYSETKRDIGMGHKRSNDVVHIGEQSPVWRKLAAGHLWLCFGRPKSVEGNKMRSIARIWRVAKKWISYNFRNGACPHKSLLPIGYGKNWFVRVSSTSKILVDTLFCNTAIFAFFFWNEGQLP